MAIDPSSFELQNVADTCAVWNLLSSATLESTAGQKGVSLCLTRFVEYECLHKPRSAPTVADLRAQGRLRQLIEGNQVTSYPIGIEDLQDIEVLERRKRLGKGELSSIVFARKTRQAVLTDDQKARRLAAAVIDPKMVQTIPHLYGWLVFNGVLDVAAQNAVLDEHRASDGDIEQHLRAAATIAENCLLVARCGQIP